MPGKSKHGKKKRYQQINRPKNIQSQANPAMSAAPAAVAPKAIAPVPTAPARKAAASSAGVKVMSHEHVPGDLQRIGILTGIIIVILAILYFILT
ncbi:MAG: hypothetical protein ABR958_08985 [Dehalococcoidales bacterium]